jgi:hypothetical protein
METRGTKTKVQAGEARTRRRLAKKHWALRAEHKLSVAAHAFLAHVIREVKDKPLSEEALKRPEAPTVQQYKEFLPQAILRVEGGLPAKRSERKDLFGLFGPPRPAPTAEEMRGRLMATATFCFLSRVLYQLHCKPARPWERAVMLAGAVEAAARIWYRKSPTQYPWRVDKLHGEFEEVWPAAVSRVKAALVKDLERGAEALKAAKRSSV